MIDLEKLKKLNAERTPGKWRPSSSYASDIVTDYTAPNTRTFGYGCQNNFIVDLNDGEYHEYSNSEEQLANAIFIAELANSLPAIIAELEALRKVADALRTFCKDDPRDSYSEVLHQALSALDEVSDVK